MRGHFMSQESMEGIIKSGMVNLHAYDFQSIVFYPGVPFANMVQP